MKIHRRIIGTVALVLGASAAVPLAAPANPLLSGYGGPGQGNQAILGSTLLNGPGSGGGSPGSGGSSSGQAGSAAGATTAPLALVAAGSSTAGARSRVAGGPARVHSAKGGGQGGLAEAGGSRAYPGLERSADASGSGSLGLSGLDFLYIALALAALAFTAALTRQITRRRPAKGHG